ncbi:MAG: SRPBCC family protein [Nitrospiraceae bacterium]
MRVVPFVITVALIELWGGSPNLLPGWPLETPAAAEHSAILDVHPDSGGGVRATATVTFPVSPAVVLAVLTDYPRWPDLFEVRMRMARIEEHDGRTTTDLSIQHSLLTGERRLVAESHALPGGGLVTDLKAGDFKRYHRVWKLSPTDGGNHTRAEFELVVELDTIMPDWLVALAMRRELEAHFRIVREKALERAKKGT